MGRSISISKARGRLPELARYLRRSPKEVVFIEHRDMEERLAIITESHLRYLQSMVAAAHRRGRGGFKLAGSITSHLTDEKIEEALATIKREQNARAQAKRGRL